MTDPNRKPRKNPLIRFLSAFGRGLWTIVQMRVIGIVLAVAAIFAGGAWLNDREAATAQRQRAADNREAAEEVYEVSVLDWRHDRDVYEACVDLAKTRVENREVLRGQLIAVVENGAERSIHQAEGLRAAVLAILPDSDEATTAMDNYVLLATDAANSATALAHASQDADYPSLVLEVERAKCIDPGPEPDRPEEQS